MHNKQTIKAFVYGTIIGRLERDRSEIVDLFEPEARDRVKDIVEEVRQELELIGRSIQEDGSILVARSMEGDDV